MGVIAALALARQGNPVTMFESLAAPVRDERAASLQPPTLQMLEALDLTKAILPLGLESPDFRFWDRPTGELVAVFDFGLLAERTPYPFVLQYEQYKLVPLVLGMLAEMPDFEIRFGVAVTDLEQSADGVAVTVDSDGGRERLEGSVLIGADGSRSTVRRALGIPFEGFTYNERFLMICTTHDFRADKDFSYRNYHADPEEPCNLLKVLGPEDEGLWRVTYPLRANETDEEALDDAACQSRLQGFIPRDTDYDLALKRIYTVSQRVAAKFHRGRVALAGDAAHVNHPVGGLGLNSGIHDTLDLCEILVSIGRGEAELDALEGYTRRRRNAAIDFVQEQTIRNKHMLEERDPDVRRRNLDALGRIAGDPEAARQYLLNAGLFTSLEAAANA